MYKTKWNIYVECKKSATGTNNRVCAAWDGKLNRFRLTTILLYDSTHIIPGYAVRMGLEKCLLGVINFLTRASKRSLQCVRAFLLAVARAARFDELSEYVVCVCCYLCSEYHLHWWCRHSDNGNMCTVCARAPAFPSTIVIIILLKGRRWKIEYRFCLFFTRKNDRYDYDAICVFVMLPLLLPYQFDCKHFKYKFIPELTKFNFSVFFHFVAVVVGIFRRAIAASQTRKNLHINLWRYFVCYYKH